MASQSSSPAFAENEAPPQGTVGSTGHERSGWSVLQSTLAPFATLRLTVVLFFLSIVLIFIGTLAQVEKNMWEVMRDYFRCWVATVEFQVLLPKTFFPNPLFGEQPQIPGGFWFPGGILLGAGLAVNLVAAHISRFKTQARGPRLMIGLLVMTFGIFLTTMVILGGHSAEGLQGTPLVSYGALWTLIRWTLVIAWIGSIGLLLKMDRSRIPDVVLAGSLCAFLGAAALFLIVKGDSVRLGDSSMRILWQLFQCLVAGLVLLLGAWFVFKKRAGIVVIHLGVGLVMFNELLVFQTAVEEQISLTEGQVASFARDIRSVELAVIDRSPSDHDDVVVIPGSMLRDGQVIQHQDLPFEMEVVEFMQNSRLAKSTTDDVNPATAGIGLRMIAAPARSAGGAETNQSVDIAALYATITPRDRDNTQQTYLLAQHFGDSDVLLSNSPPPIAEKIMVGDKTYDVLLRYKRNYKPYRITLKDVRKDDYLGTSTPRDYSSWIRLEEPSREFVRDDIRIWMNNPLRYAGQTFYQSGYAMRPDGREVTTLQVVTNTGWMVPYAACMLVVVGMLFHFLSTLTRFLRRRTEELEQMRQATPSHRADWLVPLIVAIVMGLWVAGRAIPKELEYREMSISGFGEVPIVYGGRVKPIDTLARNTLRAVSNKQDLFVPKEGDDYSRLKKEPAIRWLLDVISMNADSEKHRVFRIENLDVLTLLGLEPRKGFLYSFRELRDGQLEEFEASASAARRVAAEDASQLTDVQRKILETDNRLRAYAKLQQSFMPVPFPPIPSAEDIQKDPGLVEKTRQEIARLAAVAPRLNESLMAMEPPLVVPSGPSGELWLPFAAAANEAFVKRLFSNELPDQRVVKWTEMIDAYGRNESTDFNRALAAYRRDLRKDPPKGYEPRIVKFESFFNSFQPFVVSMALYLLAFLLTAVSWMGWSTPLRRAGFGLVLLAFAIHTLALVARIYISGRPPVTNLYSSAVFVGWGCALFGIVIEILTRIGLGNLVSTVCGFSTLYIAHNLAFGGDTFTVLQAVLDTQFWLATHVVCISLGYVATFVAGGVAVLYILGGVFTPWMQGQVGKFTAKAVYGTLCFAIFFSFFGTVLGGLWADDSWGRFWGWDPKENGALMIVLWNALILHARWGGMVRERGMCALAVLGNIVVAWSWFGVNELGIGLHSYGFTEGVLFNLMLFAATQLLVFGICWLPKDRWISNLASRPAEPTAAVATSA